AGNYRTVGPSGFALKHRRTNSTPPLDRSSALPLPAHDTGHRQTCSSFFYPLVPRRLGFLLRSRITHLHFLDNNPAHGPHNLRLVGHPMDVLPPDVFHLFPEVTQPLRLALCSVAGGPRAHVLALLPRVGDDDVDLHRPSSRSTTVLPQVLHVACRVVIGPPSHRRRSTAPLPSD